MNIYLEIFGYIGTALVIVSMMMTSVLKLRIINMSGALISLIYAVCVQTWPVAVLNACLLCINFVQTVRQLTQKTEVMLIQIGKDDSTANHLFGIWKADFEKCNPNCNLQEIRDAGAHILYVGGEAIGFSFKTQGREENSTDVLYLTPKCRTTAMKARVLAALAE